MLKVHISLEPDIADDAALRADTREQIHALVPLQNVDEGRLERRGILTADIQNASDVARILEVAGVAGVEPDQERHGL